MNGLKIFLVVLVFYFLSGLPLGYFYTFLPVQLRSQGVELSTIGLISLGGMFWSLKPIWAPFMDRLLSRSFWMLIFGLFLGVNFLLLGLIKDVSFPFLLLLFFCLTFFSASFDTALDGWFIETVPNRLQGQANGLRVSSYRVGLVISGGLAVALSQFIPSSYIPGFIGLLFLSVVPFLLRNTTFNVSNKVHKIDLSMFIEPLKDLLLRKSGLFILFFVFSYKLGDALLGGMVYPFWVDQGFSKAEIGLIAGTLGTVLTISGALIGGYITSRIGLKKALLYLGFLQAFSNLGYTISALLIAPKQLIYVASVVESFTGGLGTSAFITFLTSLCRKEIASSQYAVLSMLFSFSTSLSRGISGFLAETLGYAMFFSLSFLVALLPLFLIKRLSFDNFLER